MIPLEVLAALKINCIIIADFHRNYWTSNPCHQRNCKVGARLTLKDPSF